MSPSPSDDPLPGFMFASWLAFLVPAAWLCVHGPDILADRFLLGANFLGWPLLSDAAAVTAFREASGAALVLVSAALFSGYLLYAFAPPAVDERRLTYAVAFAASTCCALIFPFSAWVWRGPWEARMGAAVFTWLGWALYMRHALGINRALARPFVLFFRRFDSFGDLSVLPSLLRLTPNGVPVVMLVSGTENEVGYWDPLKLMAFGLRAVVPRGGRPVFLRGGEDWERVMESLVDRSSVVVLDHTEKSAAMEKEAEAVRQRGRSLILLVESGSATEAASVESGRPQPGTSIRDEAFEIDYRRGPGELAARLVLLAAIVVTILYLAEVPQQLRDKAATGELWGGIFGAVIMTGFFSTIFGGLLLRRGLTSESKRALAEALRDRLNVS